MGVPTDKLRSGDRLLSTILISGLSLQQVTTFLDPFLNYWMGNLDRVYGVRFEDPEAWKDSLVKLMIVLGTGLAGYIHMRIIRSSDKPEESESKVGDDAKS